MKLTTSIRRLAKTRSGQVALEFMLTATIMATIAGLLYMVGQSMVIFLFDPNGVVFVNDGIEVFNNGSGVKQTLFSPLP